MWPVTKDIHPFIKLPDVDSALGGASRINILENERLTMVISL